MRRLSVFNHVSLDGFFVDAHGDMSWAHRQDPEWHAFVDENAGGESELVFGRVTYQMMAGFWPTPAALERLPAVAGRMNSLPKVVFSRSLHEASWNNTRLIKDELASAVPALKREAGPDMVIMGSGNIVSQLAALGLIDEFQVVVSPIVLGRGRTMFETVKDKLALKLTRNRPFGNGNVVLWYEPAR